MIAGLRLMNELTRRSGHLNQRKWLVGVATVWEDCDSADALLSAAFYDSVRSRERHSGAA